MRNTGYYYSVKILKLSLPIVFSQMSAMLMGIVDNAMVGRAGTLYLAASAFANHVFAMALVLAIGFSIGLTPYIAEQYTHKNPHKSAQFLKHSFVLNSFFLGVLLLCLFGLYFLLDKMGQKQDVLEESRYYYLQLTFTLIPFFYFCTLRQFLEGLSITIQVLYIMIISNLINIFFNWIFIYGFWFIPPMYLRGAGWGTVIARTLQFLMILWVIFNNRQAKKYSKDFFKCKWNPDLFSKLFKIGMPISLQIGIEVLIFVLASIMMGWIGKVSLAAHQITISFASITYMFSNGIAEGGMILVSMAAAKKNLKKMKKYIRSLLMITSVATLLFSLSFFLLRNYIPLLFTNDPAVISLSAYLFVLCAIFQISDGFQIIFLGILRGIRDTKVPVYICIFVYTFCGILLSYFLGFVFDFNETGIWLGFMFGLSIVAVLLLIRIYIKIYLKPQF